MLDNDTAVQTVSAHHRNFYLHNLLSLSYLHDTVSWRKMMTFVVKEFVQNLKNADSSHRYQPLLEFLEKKPKLK
jgi:hypothetical protein